MSIGRGTPGSIILGANPNAPTVAATSDGLYVVSFTDIAPPIRYDGRGWTTVRIAQASVLAGPWTVIDTQLLTVDADPSNPAARNITTSQATTQEGFFTLTFIDATGATSQPQMQVMNQPSEIRPTVAELGAFMRSRTVIAGSGGNEAGTFNANTRPTAAEADLIIDQAVDAVLMQTGAEIPDRLIAQSRYAVLLYAAQLVELTFYRNEVNRDQSAYAQYEQLFKDTIAGLRGAIADMDPASPQAGFWSVPTLSPRQAHWQHIFAAINPTTGVLDPTKLPPDEYFPLGQGGIPASLRAQYPWAFGSGDLSDDGLAFLED